MIGIYLLRYFVNITNNNRINGGIIAINIFNIYNVVLILF